MGNVDQGIGLEFLICFFDGGLKGRWQGVSDA